MSSVNWHVFETLPGSASTNFEYLCRALIRLHFGRFGQFAALANQPGVEFHLHLTEDCALGKSGRWFGWQCRWYNLSSGTPLGAARRNKIANALSTSLSDIPGLTDWVLWTRYPLTKADQSWFNSLNSTITLHQWTSAEVESYLSGDATILRGTYFGDLILTPTSLVALHKESAARIRPRWLQEAHQIVDAERTIRRMLVQPHAWDRLQGTRENIERFAKALDSNDVTLRPPLSPVITELKASAKIFKSALSNAERAINKGNLEALLQLLARRPRADNQKLGESLRLLRAARVRAALFATNLVASICDAQELLTQMTEFFDVRVVGVLAGPGGGKTQLAAELTVGSEKRGAGILLHGQNLNARGTLDDLARTITINGVPVSSAEALAAAVDAAGRRSRCRLPIVIDGLNEAEDPRQWKKTIASFDETLRSYPYVLLVCTVRTEEFANESLPENVRRLQIPDFDRDTIAAINKYFTYFKIQADDADVPIELLSHPLTLRLFCEVTNPKREHFVGVEAMPASLTALFDRYIEKAAERIVELSPTSHRYYAQDVRAAITSFGKALWEKNERALDEIEFRKQIGDDLRTWDKSLMRALQQEGLILRISGNTLPPDVVPLSHRVRSSAATYASGSHSGVRIAAVYDAFGGHIIADALAVQTGADAISQLFAKKEVLDRFDHSSADRHPLAVDILSGLAGLLPRRLHGQQFWPLVGEPLQTTAIYEATKLEAAYVDAGTVKELASRLKTHNETASRIFVRLFRARGATNHPLNANFLDSVLGAMSMADRDLSWTEWLRHSSDGLLADLDRIESHWRVTTERPPSSRLRAIWIEWTLTSTVRTLRDKATRALYWFGRTDPKSLFELTIDSLKINDPYVRERMLAAAYGTAMALHKRSVDETFRTKIFPQFALSLFREMFAKGALHWTTHALARDYASHIIQLALLHQPRLLSAKEKRRVHPPFHGSPKNKWGKVTETHDGGFRGPIHMDFGNYTVGHLVEDRGNYDYKHPEYQLVIRSILWRIYDLGYDDNRFETAERDLGDTGYRRGRFEDGAKTDRYGKKYSWIAFFEMAGERADEGKLKEWYGENGRLSDVDIDPSFPEQAPNLALVGVELPKLNGTLSQWLERRDLPPLKPLLVMTDLHQQQGKWVLLGGYFHQRDSDQKIGLICHIRNLLFPKARVPDVQRHFRKKFKINDNFLRTPAFHYTFVGEAGWADTYPPTGKTEISFFVGNTRIRRKRDSIDDFLSTHRSHDNKSDSKDRTRYVTFEQPVQKKFNLLITTIENGWESYHTTTNPGHCPPLIGREMCETLGLHVDQQTSEFYDAQGKRASLIVKGSPPENASQEFIFLRKDLFDTFLKNRLMRAIWLVSSERELHTRNVEDVRSLYEEHGFPHGFETAITYPSLTVL